MIYKTAYIRKSGKEYQIFSKNNKALMICNSINEAEYYLNNMNLIKNAREVELSYSAIMRDLNKNNKDDIERFRSIFKKTFDEANIEGLENADKIALMAAIKGIDYNSNKKEAKIQNRMFKLATVMTDIGDPNTAGKGIASIVAFILKKIKPENRQIIINKMRDRIWNLNEQEMASKKSPASASIGNSISFVKNVLNGRDPKYIREVLRHIVGYL
jgi:hypothetical protein